MRHTAPVRPMPWISEEALAVLRGHGWPMCASWKT
jgi:hypothetical protein